MFWLFVSPLTLVTFQYYNNVYSVQIFPVYKLLLLMNRLSHLRELVIIFEGLIWLGSIFFFSDNVLKAVFTYIVQFASWRINKDLLKAECFVLF